MTEGDSPEITPKTRQALAVLFAAVEVLSSLRERMTLSLTTTFTHVAMHEGLTVSELAARCGVNGDVMSKHLRDLGAVNRRHGTGLGLVAVIQQVHGDRRERRVVLTKEGAATARQIIAPLMGKSPARILPFRAPRRD